MSTLWAFVIVERQNLIHGGTVNKLNRDRPKIFWMVGILMKLFQGRVKLFPEKVLLKSGLFRTLLNGYD